MEAALRAEEQAEGNWPQNISCSAFPPPALNALPAADEITVIRGNNSQSSVFFRGASALSKITLVLRGEAHFSSSRVAAGAAGAAGRRCRSREGARAAGLLCGCGSYQGHNALAQQTSG